MQAPLLVGRDGEMGEIVRLLDGVTSSGTSLVLEGAPGIGKSRLLDEACEIASRRDMTVSTTAGVQSEADLPFAGLHQLLRPFLSRLVDLPAPQREALDAAFGLGHAAAPEPFLTALGALGVLCDVAADRPLLVGVEDAHWLDRPSADALAFIARRLQADAIVMMIAIREGYESPLRQVGLAELHLDGLADDAVQHLLDEQFPDLSGTARSALVDEAEGNPLALVELGTELHSEARRDPDDPARLPLTLRVQQAFATRAAELPRATRTTLLVAATDEEAALSMVLAAAAMVDGAPRTVGDLEPAGRAKLVDVTGQRVRFRHPLVRSAIYQSATVGDRRAAHLALAELYTDDPDRSTWHRAATAVGPDARVAAGLEEAGQRALRRGAATTAAVAFERAAELTPDPAQRGRLTLAAAAAASELGQGPTVIRLLRQAGSLELGPRERAQRLLLEDGFRDGPVGDARRVRDLVDTAASVAAAGDLAVAPDLLVAAASRCYWGNLRQEGREVVRAADRLGLAPHDQRLIFVQAFAMPIERSAVVLRALEGTVPPEDPTALYLRGMAICLTGAFDRALSLLTESAQRLRTQGRLRMLAQVLSIRAWAALELGDFAVAIPSAEEASRLSSEIGHPLWETGALTAQAGVAALRGDRAAVERLTAETYRIALPIGAASLLSLAQYARGVLELGEGRHAEAYEQLRRISDPADPACHDLTACHCLGDLAEAAAHSDHRDAAVALMRDLEPRAEQLPSSWAHAQLLLARVQLGADGSADVFDEALGRDLTAYPAIRARIELAHGEWLRRNGRHRESRAPLRAARDTFDPLGMGPWAERARRELRASGESSSRRAPDSLDELSPQELQIAQLAAQGFSNRDIAQRLYLSHRTVESHLYRVFPKLGVTSRLQLAGALGGKLGAPG